MNMEQPYAPAPAHRPHTDSQPFAAVAKDTECHMGEGGVRYAAASMQGWRDAMEDAHIICPRLADLPGHSFVAVFDGHGGAACARFAAQTMPQLVEDTQEFRRYKLELKSRAHDGSSGGGDAGNSGLIEQALRQAFIEYDNAVRRDPASAVVAGKVKFKTASALKDPATAVVSGVSGCAAVCAVITPRFVALAHAGDSRAIVCSGGSVVAATKDHKPRSPHESGRIIAGGGTDHKPSSPHESGRIVAGGGTVEHERVDGRLAMSRALANFKYKNGGVAPGDEKVYWRRPDDECLIMCCDGVWDVMTNQECHRCVAKSLVASASGAVQRGSTSSSASSNSAGSSSSSSGGGGGGSAQPASPCERVTKACTDLLDACLYKGSVDNMTAIVVTFGDGIAGSSGGSSGGGGGGSSAGSGGAGGPAY
ncbi:phosphatase 2C-like domain-containing protein [Tribonema minus]|uniref:Phosphatase 2C-like domain-containing protein n=1 Tax=Tribonema minus TaxID=303371 RepID=A0A835ZBU3_9STRA|nr:phosphatase 2C-like domain-containing protein [Tribonema minus]